jgi:hypothetical protein
VADPGVAGFWIARTFPTSFPGTVCVPASAVQGFAAAAALVCGLEGRPCLAVSDQIEGPEGLDEPTAMVLEIAESLGVPAWLQLWGDRGQLESSTAHVELLAHSLAPEGVRLVDVPVDSTALVDLERAAGSVRAWS